MFHYHTSALSALFMDEMHHSGLFQINGHLNTSGRVLDLVFVNNAVASVCLPLELCLTPLLAIDTYHPALELAIPLPREESAVPALTSRLVYARTDFNRLLPMIASFANVFDCSRYATLDLAVKDFKRFMLQALNECTPVKRPKRGAAQAQNG